jgi:hypothetical protein
MGGGINWFNKSTQLGYIDQGNGWRISSATSQPLTFNGTGINMQFDGTTVAAIKSVSNSYELQVTGTDFGQIRLICGNYGMFFCNNGTTFDLLSSSSGAPTGARNGFVPFRYNMVSGAITFGAHSSASVTIGNDSTNTVNVNGHLFASSCISTPLINTGATGSVYGFAMLDTDGNGAADLAYTADSTAGLTKYVLNGSTWTSKGTIATAIAGLSAYISGTSVILSATSASGTTLYAFTDSSLTGNLTGSLSSIATAATNTAFRGVVAVPAPGAAALVGLAGLITSRRRKA